MVLLVTNYAGIYPVTTIKKEQFKVPAIVPQKTKSELEAKMGLVQICGDRLGALGDLFDFDNFE